MYLNKWNIYKCTFIKIIPLVRSCYSTFDPAVSTCLFRRQNISGSILTENIHLFFKSQQGQTITNITSNYNSFLVYCRELAPGTVSLTGDRAQGDDSKHDSHYSIMTFGVL